jgi:acyl phosphate:glycerol-3-phosphate acyltransferase
VVIDLSGWPTVILAALAGYLIGSIPVGYLVGRVAGVDPRATGSGKMGATNVLRTLGRKASATVLLCDIGKGALAVGLAHVAFQGLMEAEVAAGIAAILGHVFPVFVGFRGGRGVATAIGGMLVISPLVGLAGLLTGLVIIAVFRVASLGSLLGALLALLLIAALVMGRMQPAVALVYCLLSFLILAATHRDNIQRLATGTERKIQL